MTSPAPGAALTTGKPVTVKATVTDACSATLTLRAQLPAVKSCQCSYSHVWNVHTPSSASRSDQPVPHRKPVDP
ncbi:hypothetical protein [Nonomuraea deserti]|uniref:hypothetical protein n=1 Tax=Nonomuraea deserti TaxID=1848322 RepID=UPI003F6DEE7E